MACFLLTSPSLVSTEDTPDEWTRSAGGPIGEASSMSNVSIRHCESASHYNLHKHSYAPTM